MKKRKVSKGIRVGDKVRLRSYVRENKEYAGYTMFKGMVFDGFLSVVEETDTDSVLLENAFFYPKKVLTKSYKVPFKEKALAFLEKANVFRKRLPINKLTLKS